MVTSVGDTAKFAPLADVPSNVPSVDAVYQLMLLPADVAFKFEAAPLQIIAGDALSPVGTAGNSETARVKLVELLHR